MSLLNTLFLSVAPIGARSDRRLAVSGRLGAVSAHIVEAHLAPNYLALAGTLKAISGHVNLLEEEDISLAGTLGHISAAAIMANGFIGVAVAGSLGHISAVAAIANGGGGGGGDLTFGGDAITFGGDAINFGV